MEKHIKIPMSSAEARSLRAGDQVLLSGVVYTARDAAHQRLVNLLEAGEELPLPLEGAGIYYVGPTPAQPGKVCGSAGPTTSTRMDAFSPALIAAGLRFMIGKGNRSAEVVEAMQKHGCVYFAAIGGAGALIAQCIKKLEVLAWDDLGCEALRRLEVENFPAIVAIDTVGGNLYKH